MMQLDLFKETSIPNTDIKHKTCTCCGVAFPNTTDYFQIASTSVKDGKKFLKPMCKDCESDNQAATRVLKKKHKEADYQCCAICGVDKRELMEGKLVFDHCHTTLKFRGFLCRSCNTGIGALRDDPDIFLKAIQYLEANRER